MKVAVVGSRCLRVEHLEDYLPKDTTEIISGGARGVDASAREYALRVGLKLTEYLPEYSRYGRSAPLKRNITILENADLVLAFWDGKSKGTKYVIENCKQRNIPVAVHVIAKQTLVACDLGDRGHVVPIPTDKGKKPGLGRP